MFKITQSLFTYIISIILFTNISLASNITQVQSDESKKWRSTWLTQEEQQWLNQYNVIIHGMVGGKRHVPFEYTDEFNIHQGLTSDYLQIVSEKLGIEIQSTLRTPKFAQLSSALIDEKIDFVSYIPKSVNLAKQVSFSKAIVKMPVVILGRQDASIIQGLNSLQSEIVAVQYGTFAHKLLAKNHPHVEITFVKSTVAGLEAVDNQEVDVFIHNVFSAEYYQRKLGITGLKVLATTPYNYEIMFATSKKMSPLVSIIEKAIADISEREKRLIFDKWINIQIEKKLDIQLVIQSLLAIAVIIIFIVGFFTHWNRQLAKKVAERTIELRNLARHMQQVREEEKAKLAREIHDELGHTLTALTIGIRRLRSYKDEHQRTEKSKELGELVKSASQTSKQIMTDLRPSILEDLGLVAAIEWLAHEFKTRHQVNCHVTAHESQIVLSDEAAIALFRITQESLTNIAKHAHASQVEIVLTLQEQDLLLLISDNGQGLKVGWATKEGSYGLQGMQERALALGGELNVESKTNKGVQLLVRIPLLSSP